MSQIATSQGLVYLYMKFLVSAKKYASLIAGFFLAAITFGLHFKYKRAVETAEKLSQENEELRQISQAAILEKEAANNYAKHREDQLKQERIKRKEIEDAIKDDPEVSDFFDQRIPDRLRKNGL